ncbi:polysaccharide pyruvyl transferase family protein [Methanobrevibacter arboriphilus]|uniref:polysaccharide pyruvyl transferase family protein n=1 Tax=Methanobrevibacter arboriphilus TaxID=39441 RepID=UPI0006939F91|nr:polysaccharide pyruvyl transferase family protein [Methanobrevibacter arboriphilus]
MVIGCPAMFSFGNHLKIRNTVNHKKKNQKTQENSVISINSGLYSQNINNFISKTMKEFPNYYFIPQWRSELRLTYIGRPKLKYESEVYPVSMESLPYKNNRVRAPINAQGWINFLKKVDLSFGARLHGNIMATISGTPSILIVKDGRMRELAEFHNLTHITEKELIKFNSLIEIIEKVDFKSPEKVHEDRFKNYLKFWRKNKIETVYDKNFNLENLYIDSLMKKEDSLLPIETISNLKKEEINKRLKDFKTAKKSWKKEIHENNEINKLLSSTKLYNKILNHLKNLI